MKILLWSLLALNGLAAALWLSGFSLPATPRPEPAAPTLTAKRLELLSELPSLPPRIDAQSAQSAPSEAGPQAADPSVTAPPAAETSAANAPDAPAAADTAPPATPASEGPVPAPAVAERNTPPPENAAPPPAPAPAAAPVSDVPEVASAPAATPPAVADGNAADAGSAALPATPEAKANVTAEQDAPVCHRTAAVAPEAKDRIGAAVRDAKLGEPVLKSSLRPRFWVYWTGAPAKAAGVEAALKAAGVKDWYRVGGASQATISLGVYGQVEGARRRQRELAAKAIQASIDERYPAQAQLRWQITARPSAVAAAAADLALARVRLERCP